jgi:hypothetical protein
MKTYIITRFSILDENSGKWVITRNLEEKDKLKDILFDKSRLDEKFFTFENITYNSIISQTNKNFIWIILTSTYLPEKYKKFLYTFSCEYIKIIEVDNIKEFNNYIKNISYEKDFSTVRLDDDDGLNPNFIEKLNDIYNQSDKNEVVSFIKGRKITSKNEKFYIEKEIISAKNIALGLTKFNGNIYSLGNHNKIHIQNKVIYDETPNMYLLYASENCDTKRKFNFENMHEIKNINDAFL